MGNEKNEQDHELEELLGGQSASMIFLKCHDILKKSLPLTTFDLQNELVNQYASKQNSSYNLDYYINLFSHPNFIKMLRMNERMNFDETTRCWSFVSPYQDINSCEDVQKLVENSKNGI